MKYIFGSIIAILVMAAASILIAVEVDLIIALPIWITGWILLSYSLDKFLYPDKTD